MLLRQGNSYILFQFTDTYIKAIKWKECKKSKIDIEAYAREELTEEFTADNLRPALKTIFDKIAYTNEKAIIVITHQKATSRYLKFPSNNATEIEDMIQLQASKILPFPAEEIIIGYQVTQVDKNGFSGINLVLSHKTAVEDIVSLLQEFSIEAGAVYADVYGLQQLIRMSGVAVGIQALAVMLEPSHVTMSVLQNQRIALSRFVNLSQHQPDWKQQLAKNITETQSFYLRQADVGPIKKIILVGAKNLIAQCKQELDQAMAVPVEVLSVPIEEKINPKVHIDDFPDSLMGILGFVLNRPPESLSLLPKILKQKRNRIKQAKNKLKILLLILGSLFFLTVSSFLHIGNKERYCQGLGKRIEGIKMRAGKLEVMAKKLLNLKFMRQERKGLLDFFYAIHKAKPDGIILGEIRFNSEQKTKFVLKGSARQRNSVFEYASNLKDLGMFNQEEIEVKHATSKENRNRDWIDFEIVFRTED